MFHYTRDVAGAFQDVVSRVEEELKKEQFGVLWSLNVKEKLQEKGLDFKDDYIILEVCNPAEAQNVLNENKLAGYFLPCKIAVYTDRGQTKVGIPRPSVLIANVAAEDSPLRETAEKVEAQMKAALDRV